MKTRKIISEPHNSVHFKNGQNAKNDLKPTNAKNADENEKNVSPGHMPVYISKMGQMPKTLIKTKKYKTMPHVSMHFKNGSHTSVHFENWPNVKNG